MGAQNADFTRPLDPHTPSIGDRLPKRSHTGDITVPGPLLYGGKARKTTITLVALQEGIKASCNVPRSRDLDIEAIFLRWVRTV
jgi:hypothetical protein